MYYMKNGVFSPDGSIEPSDSASKYSPARNMQ
jgi:hypothetical protein